MAISVMNVTCLMTAELCYSFLLSITKGDMFQRVDAVTENTVFVHNSIYEKQIR